MQKIKIDLHILLPELPNERDECVQRIIAVMQKHKGIEEVHLIPKSEQSEAQLCFHYDTDIISLDQIQDIALKEGAAITHKYGHLLMEVKAFRETNEAELLERQLRKLKGILSVSVSATGTISIEYDQQLTDRKNILDVLSKDNINVESNEDVSEPNCCQNATTHADKAEESKWRTYLPVAISLAMLLAGIVNDQYMKLDFFNGWVRFAWYAIAYLPVGYPVAMQGIRLIIKGDFFTEFVLMTIATLGAFFVREYPEGVAVMVFYTVGELFQDAAVNRAKRSIKALLDIRPASAFVKRNGSFIEVQPKEVNVDDIIQVKAGEKVPLDGEMLSDGSAFNTAALTGESKPSEISKGESVLAGMINQDKAIEIKVTKLFNDSSLARILSLVQEATTRKAKTEQFIRKFSRIYTPIVVFVAIGIATVPYFFVQDYVFNQWLYRALIFLVVSCPCALVISIPLGYFGGIGAASRNGILFKGSNFLDLITKANVVVMDKTGTLTKGVFKVQQVKSYDMDEAQWLPMAAALEVASTHPVAQAVVQYAGEKAKGIKVEGLEEIAGHGIKGIINGKEVYTGNLKLMDKVGIQVNDELKNIDDTIVIVAVDKKIVGYITIADEIKEDSKEAIKSLHDRKIETIMLSGDKQSVVDRVAKELGIDKAFGDLLPEGKVKKVEEIKRDKSKVVVFVGDGINDAPVLALSDIGMAMGGLGSDAAIETADVIIQTDQPSRIAKAIQIGKATNSIVWQNITFAFIVKAIVMVLGAGGIATMWEAVFADVGVALLAVLNAMRIQKMKF
jgi:Zn2+/Cd2+-exporting ATPase